MAGRHPTGQEGGERQRTPPPPAPPPACGPQERRPLAPPEPEGRPPSTRRNRHAGREPSWTRMPRAPAAPAACSRLLPRGSQPTGEPAPERRGGARTMPGGGTRRRTRAVWGPPPPMARASPVAPAILPTRGGRREGLGLTGPPGGQGFTGCPPPPPARQAAPGARGGPATPTERARRRGMRRRREEGQGREPRAIPQRKSRGAAAQTPPPLNPPAGPQTAGAPAPTPSSQRGWSPLPQA